MDKFDFGMSSKITCDCGINGMAELVPLPPVSLTNVSTEFGPRPPVYISFGNLIVIGGGC